MPKMAVNRWNRAEQGLPTANHFRTVLRESGYEVSEYTYPPGTVFAPHTHPVDKIDVVLSGQFRMEMFGESVILEAGDSLAVPKGALHSAEVVGDEPVVSLDAARVD